MADTAGLDPQFAVAIQKLVDASGGRIWINSGYRSNERQQGLYDQAVKKYGAANAGKWVAPPGHSNHNFGLAVDLGGDLNLAHQLAPEFGLTFPMSWEPWHIEPPWARGKRGQDYKSAYTTPPDGSSASADDPYGQLHVQIGNFLALINGNDPSSIDSGFSPSTAAFSADEGTAGQPVGANGSVRYPAGEEPGGRAGNPGGTMANATTVYEGLVARGVDPLHAAALTAIAGRESSYNAAAHNDNAQTGDNSFGLFQINKLGGMHSQWSDQSLLTVGGSLDAGAELVKSGGLQPWGGYKGVPWYHGVSDQYLQDAVNASGGAVTLEQLRALEN